MDYVDILDHQAVFYEENDQYDKASEILDIALEASRRKYDNLDVETTQTPEETHRMFVDKLKEGDLDGAVECCFVKSDWESMKDFIRSLRCLIHSF